MRRLLSLVCALMLLFCALPSAQAASKTLTVSFTAETYQNRARSALKLINQYREKNGLEPLTMLADLEKAAIQRAGELFVFFDHKRPDMTDFDTVAKEYDSLKKATAQMECIAAGYSKAEDVVAEWKEEDALLDADFTHVGLACVYVKGSANEYYWVCYLQGQPDGIKARKADSTAKAGKSQTMKVEIASGMFSRADSSHKRFELRVEDIAMKTRNTAQPTVYLYDRYDVKIGKCELEDLTFKSGSTSVFTVQSSGTIRRKKAGTAKLTVKFSGLSDATCTVTIGSSSDSVTASTIKDAKPVLTAREYTSHTSLTVSLKGASGYVLYRSNSKNGTYTKVDEQATTKSCTFKLEDVSKACYYKVRAYKNSNGKRVYSQYSDPVRVEP